MIRLKHLVRSPQLQVLRLDHEPDIDHSDPEEEVCSHYAINFVEAGSFELVTQKKGWMLYPGYVFVSQRGAVHHYTHRERMPTDICVSVVYAGSFIKDRSEEHFVPKNIPVAMPPTNRLAFLKLRLAQLASDGYAFALEDWACELISAFRRGFSNENRLYRQQQLRWYAERVQAIRELFETRFAESHSLLSVARSVGMSPFQFARVFSQLAGLPPHQYLLGVRLDRASKMLLDGKAVTETCFEVGFSNLSHFTRSFHRRFGCVPSSFKRSQSRSAMSDFEARRP